MHMELFGIRNGTKVWFGPRCEVACIGDIQFCTISKLARHRKGCVVAQLSQGWATHNLQTGTLSLQPNRRIGCLTQINCDFTAGCCQALVRDGCQVLTLEQGMRKKNTCVEPWIPQRGATVWRQRLTDTQGCADYRVKSPRANRLTRQQLVGKPTKMLKKKLAISMYESKQGVKGKIYFCKIFHCRTCSAGQQCDCTVSRANRSANSRDFHPRPKDRKRTFDWINWTKAERFPCFFLPWNETPRWRLSGSPTNSVVLITP